MEVHLGRVLGAAGDVRDLAKRQLLEDAELEDQALLGWQRVERTEELGAPLGVVDALGADGLDGDVHPRVLGREGAPVIAQVVQAQVGRDAKEPRAKRCPAAEGVEPLVGLDEGALRHVLGLVVVANETPGEVKDRALMAAHELLERPGIAGAEAVNEDLVLAARRPGFGVERFGDGHAQHFPRDPVLATGVKRRYRTSLAVREAKEKMLDPARLDAVLRRGPAVKPLLHAFAEVDSRRKSLQGELDALRAQRNASSEAMAGVKDKKSDAFAAVRDELRLLSQRIKEGEKELSLLENEARERQLWLPNAPHDSVPDGTDESANVVVSTWGEPPELGFQAKDHVDLGTELGILDFERGAKLSGARFTVLSGPGARLVRALMSFMLDVHASRGYREMWVPVLLKRPAMEGTGQLPKFADDAFRTVAARADDEYYLAPTAEVPLTNLHREEILEPGTLPVRYTAYTACFRAEAGAYGKDTRGMIRQHQFDKVELVKFVDPDTSYAELEGLRADAEEILRRLGLHYRVSLLCAGDLGNSSAKTYDLEVWLPGQDAYREISSCSNFEDWQARRAMIRYRPAVGEKPRFVHTLNGSGLAIGRTLVALLEQGQKADGSVEIPEALRPYTGFDRIAP